MSFFLESTDRKLQTVTQHIRDLRICVFWCFLSFLMGLSVSLLFKDQLFSLFCYPFRKLGQTKIYLFAPYDAFFIQVKLIAVSALFVSLPFMCVTIWNFCSPAISYQSRLCYRIFLTAFVILFFCGFFFSYFFVFPIVLKFFLSFENDMFETLLSAQKYFQCFFTFLLSFGLVFTCPIVLFFLYYLEILSLEFLRSQRKIVFISILILASFLTPPDVFSQILLAFPLYFFYECSMIAMSVFSKNKKNISSNDDGQ